MVNPPVITIFIGGIVTIPSHGWFIIIVLPTLKYTCLPPSPLKGVGGTGALAHSGDAVGVAAKHSFSYPGRAGAADPPLKSFSLVGFSRFSGSGVDKKIVKFEDAFWRS